MRLVDRSELKDGNTKKVGERKVEHLRNDCGVCNLFPQTAPEAAQVAAFDTLR